MLSCLTAAVAAPSGVVKDCPHRTH